MLAHLKISDTLPLSMVKMAATAMMTTTTMMIIMAKRIAGYAALEDKGNTLTTTLNTSNNEQLHK